MRNYTWLSNSFFIFLLSFALFSCKDEVENFSSDNIKDYYPLATGKYITYRLDSTVFTTFGTVTEVRSYQVKYQIDQPITDNQGRPAFRVYRYRRDLAGTQPWEPYGSLTVTLVDNQIEVAEDNLRIIKLHMPMRQDYTWPGNSYLPTSPYNNLFQFSNDDFMQLWDYTYTNVTDVFRYNNQTLQNVATVLHIDERLKLDTVDVVNNTAAIPKNATGVFLRGTATDTVRMNTQTPDPGRELMTIYNQTNKHSTLNGIAIPPDRGFTFQYANGRWFYQNNLIVPPLNISVQRGVYTTTITGNATDTIRVNTTLIDTNRVKSIRVYNYSAGNQYAVPNFAPVAPNSTTNRGIVPGTGQTFELRSGNWISTTAPSQFIQGTALGSTNYSIEKYAKGIGMVYKELLMWEFQPNTTGGGGNFFGFGVKLSMIDHN